MQGKHLSPESALIPIHLLTFGQLLPAGALLNPHIGTSPVFILVPSCQGDLYHQS